jgi:mono/diheme cytochrome c family protein
MWHANVYRVTVTEIPEHLLKRSRERRSALGQGDGEAAGAAPAASTPATTTPAAPAAATPSGPPTRAAAPTPAGPPPPKPDSFVVSRYKDRKKVPFWAMGALGLLPIWMFMYVRSVTASAQEATGPLGMGAEVYSNCASCHGGNGGGGVGYQFSEGEVLKTFPHIEDQLRYVLYGTGAYNVAGVEIYGNPDREGGPHLAGARGAMPGFAGSLTDYEILAVVCHERYALGGADGAGDYAEEFETWCSPESEIFVELEGGAMLSTIHEAHDGVLTIGDGPAAGSAAD